MVKINKGGEIQILDVQAQTQSRYERGGCYEKSGKKGKEG